MTPMTLLLIVYLFAGLVLIGLSIPLLRGKVGPNPWYGFRVRRTLENPDIWYPVNRYGARWTMGVGVAVSIVSTALFFLPGMDFVTYAVICGTVLMAGLIIGCIQSFAYLNRLTK